MIFTFYSYKGGVGRSMALANVAEYLCRRGLRVAMVDWDLEAPGLETFFTSGDSEVADQIADRLGLMDLLAAYKRLFPRLLSEISAPPSVPVLDVLRRSLATIQGFLQPVPRPWARNGDGTICLLSAGWRSPEHLDDYVRSVQSFDWAGFYTSYQGEAYFNWLREQLKSAADVILIDSRTGVTEMGGICTRQLADVVVSFCAPNSQNLLGVANVIESFHRKDLDEFRDKQLEVLVVPARLDRSEISLRNAFEADFRRVLAELPTALRDVKRTFWDLSIPYIPKYSYMEQLAIGVQDTAQELAQAYEKLALYLALFADEGQALRTCLAGDLQREFPELLPSVFLVCAGPEFAASAESLRARIAAAGISVWHTVADLEARDSQRLLATLEHARHIILLLSSETASQEGVRRLWYAARERGIWVHLVGAAWPKTERDLQRLPPWVRNAQVYAPDRDESTLLDLLRTKVAAPRFPQMAPALPDPYVPRPAELAVTVDSLLSGRRAVAIWGLGGAGKTTLAAAVCRDDKVLAHFDGILWATLGHGSDLLKEWERIYAGLTGEELAAVTLRQAGEKLSGALAGRNCLLVLDDVPGPSQLEPCSPLLEQSSVLLTSRTRQVARALDAEVIVVGEMDASEAAQLIVAGVGELTGREEEIPGILRHLGCLPLALRLANGYLRQEIQASRDAAAALARLRELLATHSVITLDDPGADRSRSLARTLAECLDALSRTERQRYLELASADSSEWTLATVQDLWQVPAAQASALLNRFTELALVQEARVASGNASIFLVPPLLRSYTERRASTPTVSAIAEAREILLGRAESFDGLLKLTGRLKAENAFGYARRILLLARRDPSFPQKPEAVRRKVLQQLALATYKDVDQPAEARLERALEILSGIGDLAKVSDPETLGLAGAIHKRKWEIDSQPQHLERSLTYYLRGYRSTGPSSPDYDYGYTGINAAFVLDLLASQEEDEARRGGGKSESAETRRAQAKAIREELRTVLPSLLANRDGQELRDQWWFLATLAEACFGLGLYGEARAWIAQARALPRVADWEIESTARQFASLALYTQGAKALASDGEVSSVLFDLVGGSEAALLQARVGKVGLALSGGGFRASLFHIGVLARLAELDALRTVEVLSCVSGGSIIGAHYYLEVRALLERKPDSEIDRDDYITIVERIARDFLAGVQTNIRTRATASLRANLEISLVTGYTRTNRAGELYERSIFQRIPGYEGGIPPLDQLIIRPSGEPVDFTPKRHNWRRRAKVPILILNATTLNTGHNWQFTASFMGEPPGRIDTRIDGNERLRRMYYHEAPPRYRHIRLGDAVAASSCVPGLFEPLTLDGLYPDRVVRLVDGGVHDNQGTAGLIEQDCTLLLVSDASGQMQSQSDPGGGVLGPPLRANTILQARVRDAQYHEVEARRRSSLLRGLMFVHLKKDLDTDPIDWIGCEDPFDAADGGAGSRRGILTSYGVRKDVQARLAGLRTDLDSFSDLEAFALMTSGYRMTERTFPDCVEGFPLPDAPPAAWRFLAVDRLVRSGREGESERELARLLDVLSAGSHSAFKLWSLSRSLQLWTRSIAGIALVALLGWLFSQGVLTLPRLGWFLFIALLVASGLLLLPLHLSLSLASAFSLLFNRRYLRQGRLRDPGGS